MAGKKDAWKNELVIGLQDDQGQYFIVSRDKVTGLFSMSSRPYFHGGKAEAVTEAERLSKLDTSREYVVVGVVDVVATEAVVVRPKYDITHRSSI